MINKVLVAIDNTGLASQVVDTLSAQMHPDQTEVLVLEVVEPLVYSVPPEMSPGYAPEQAARRKQSQELAKVTVEQAVKALEKAGFKASKRVVEGEPKEGILGVAAEWKPDVIVVTSHARQGVAKFFHRSVAEGVVHGATCAVLVIKETAAKKAA
jgi:nucleotide-binding universal stress UspA family protein